MGMAMSGHGTTGAVVLLIVVVILALWGAFGTVRDVARDGYGRREHDRDRAEDEARARRDEEGLG